MKRRKRITDNEIDKLLGDLTLKACDLLEPTYQRSEFITYMQTKIKQTFDAAIKREGR